MKKLFDTILRKYGIRLIRKIGESLMSWVYEAEINGEKVAVKIPKIDLSQSIDVNIRRKLEKEIEIWRRLSGHPNIVELKPITLQIQRDILGAIVMELCKTSLRELLNQRGKLNWKEAIEIILQIIDGLDYAHHMGIVHRDLKPENILLGYDGKWKISDWGLAKVLWKQSISTNGFKGTPLYAAPEQIDKKNFGNVDWRTDIWQIGCIMYEMITRKPPFQAENILELTIKIIKEEPEYPPEIPEELCEIIKKCLKKKKEERWYSLGELRIKLQEIIKPQTHLAQLITPTQSKIIQPLQESITLVEKIVKDLGGEISLQGTSLEIELSGGYIGNYGVIALARALEKLKNLTSLTIYLGENNIDVDGTIALARALERLEGLTFLLIDLALNNIGDSGATALARALERLEGLTFLEINLSDSYIGDSGATALARALEKLKRLTELGIDLANNNIGDSGATALARALERLEGLTFLYIALYNNIGFRGKMVLKKLKEKFTFADITY